MSAPTYADFIADPKRKENTVAVVTGYDRIALVERTYYFSSREFATGPADTPASQLFDRRIIGRFERTASAIGGEGGVRSLAGLVPLRTVGLLRLKQFFGDLDTGSAACLQGTALRDISFGGRAITVLHGGSCSKGVLPFTAYRPLTVGVVKGEPTIGKSDATFHVHGQDERLRYPVQSRLLFGTDRCVVFNGTSTAIDCGTDTAFSFTSGAFSGSFHLYAEAFPVGSDHVVMIHGDPNVDGWAVRYTTTGTIKVFTYQAGANQFTESDVMPLDRPVEVQFSRTGSAVTILFDGEDATATAGTHIDPAASTTRHLYIGRNQAGTVFLRGAMDEIRIAAAATTEDGFEERQHRPLDSSEYGDFLLYLNCDDGGIDGTITTVDNKGSLGATADGTVTDGFCASACMGVADAAGRPMPSAWGNQPGFQPVCVDVGRQIYLAHSSRAEELTHVRVGGSCAYNRIFEGDAEGDDYTSWLDFIVATTADGAVDTCLSPGWTLFRIGGLPSKKPTVDIKGDKSDGTYRNTVGAICRYVITTCGQQPFDDLTEIDDASWDAFEAAHPEEVGYAFTDDRNVEDMVADLCRTFHAAVWPKRSDGTLAIKQIGDPQTETPVLTLTRNHVRRGTLTPQERGSPFRRWIFYYAENPTVMGAGDLYELLGTEDPDAAAFCRQRWRRVEYQSPTVARLFLDAGTFEVETRFVQRADANAERNRFSSLSKRPDQGFAFTCRPPGTELELFDVVVFDYQDRNRRRILQQRFGTHDDARYYVTGISDLEGGTFELNVWRPRVV
jgi:hypothetical protein